MICFCEAPKSMVSNYFVKKKPSTFGGIWRIQIQIYPKTDVELKYGPSNLKNQVSAHKLGLVVQLSWRVAPPLIMLVQDRPTMTPLIFIILLEQKASMANYQNRKNQFRLFLQESLSYWMSKCQVVFTKKNVN